MKFLFIFVALFAFHDGFSQDTNDQAYIKSIFDNSLTQSSVYSNLKTLTSEVGSRLSGSSEAAKAVQLTQKMLLEVGLDSVWLQPCMVPHWERGETEQMYILGSTKIPLTCLALGNSVGTGKKGLKADVIEVSSLDEVEKLGREKIEGKIVFFNRPMDPTIIKTIHAYGKAVDQRVFGPKIASKYGAVAAINRSLTTKLDDIAHTGVTIYQDEKPIPALAISTLAAEKLHQKLQKGNVRLFIRNTSKNLPEEPSFNVIGEIKGNEFPDEIILIGGHLDSWDVGTGAHDDGAGVMQSIGVLELFKKMNYHPKRTIRCVLFMNEENGGRGAKAYQKISNQNGEFHLAAIESDLGGFTPRSFSCDGSAVAMKKYFDVIKKWESLFLPYGIQIEKGGSGADIGPLKSQDGMLIGFKPDSQRYFDYHHSRSDEFKAVNQRELEMGLGAITSLIYMIDQYGL